MDLSLQGIKYSLGAGKEKRETLSALSLALMVFFYFFVVGSLLPFRIYSFLNRVTYDNIFNPHVINNTADTFIILILMIIWVCLSINGLHRKLIFVVIFATFLILLLLDLGIASKVGALLTVPVLFSLIVIDKFRSKSLLNIDGSLVLSYVALAAVLLACVGITSLLISILTGLTTISSENYAYVIYQQLLSNFSPIIMIGLAFCVPFKIIITEFFTKLKTKKDALLMDTVQEKLSRKQVSIYLLACALLAISISYIPHISTVNPNNERLGVDSNLYSGWVNMLKNQNASLIQLAFKDISSGDRPLTLIIFYLITETIKVDTFHVVEFSPLILVPLLAIITFFLTRELTSNDKISIIAAFLSSISFQSLIGMYAGFYANWLALILGYVAFGLVVKYLRSPSKLTIVALAVTIIGVLLAHLYTWTIIICIAFVFLLVLFILNYYPRKRILVLCLILSSAIAIDILKSSWTGSSTGLEADVTVGFQHGFGISQFNERFKTLADTVQTYYGGAFANIAILSLVLYWLVRCKIREWISIFVLIFLSSALIPVLLGDWVLQSRVLYNIPFQIPAAISLYAISKENHKLIFIAILFVTGYLSFHVLANLGYVPPSSGGLLIER